MNILISSILFPPDGIGNMHDLLKAADDPEIGVEVFPFWQLTRFENILKANLPLLQGRRIVFHSQYQCTDPCFPIGTPEYDVSMKYYNSTFTYAKMLGAAYIVFHYYNFHFDISEREEKLKVATKNLGILKSLARGFGLKLAIENTEITRDGCYMFTEDSFIQMARSTPDCHILIDIGHANCAGWDLSRVIRELSDKIVGYHLHNNNGMEDSHCRILDGTLDMDRFMQDFCLYTPGADLTIEYSPDLTWDTKDICEDINFLKRYA
ncbi:MAG TPA: sugar phosphate isomerase/epimerase [Bacillota bacterium]|nr:sugar phosphate isomerase/epimerase [Bacillota bacterium]HOR86279.1 sugar phosphate isomerase/epimerase [Bacillota bacterium]HPL53630.1 sugar phosphate isomerase/epimerase [Bacillota bacterium]